VAATAGGLLLSRQFALRGFTWFGAPVRKVALCLLPGLFAGGVLTVVEWKAQQLHAIPGTWLLLYGCALVCTSAMTSKIIGVLGGLFGALALVAFWVPDSTQIPVLGLGFGGLHLGFGIVMRGRDHGDKATCRVLNMPRPPSARSRPWCASQGSWMTRALIAWSMSVCGWA
jgi:hypothetical protein